MATPIGRYARVLMIVGLVGGLLALASAASAQALQKKLIKCGWGRRHRLRLCRRS